MVVAVNETKTRPSAMDESTILQNSILPAGRIAMSPLGIASNVKHLCLRRSSRPSQELAAETTENPERIILLKSGLQDGCPERVLVSA